MGKRINLLEEVRPREGGRGVIYEAPRPRRRAKWVLHIKKDKERKIFYVVAERTSARPKRLLFTSEMPRGEFLSALRQLPRRLRGELLLMMFEAALEEWGEFSSPHTPRAGYSGGFITPALGPAGVKIESE